MTRANTEIQVIRQKSKYGPMPYGMFAGVPTMSVKLSASPTNSIKVTSLENIFTSRNWKRKVNSGYARLRIFGHSPFSDEHEESLSFLTDVLDPRFLDFEIQSKYIDEVPSTHLRRKADTFSFVFDMTKEEDPYDEDILRDFSDSASSLGGCQYIFKCESEAQEQDIKEFVREYKVYDSDIWVYPKGRKMSTASENAQSILPFVKRNRWRFSPRMDLFFDYEEETE